MTQVQNSERFEFLFLFDCRGWFPVNVFWLHEFCCGSAWAALE
jgi:hypothetical protein